MSLSSPGSGVSTAASGSWGVVLWAIDATGAYPAREFYLTQSTSDRAKLNTIFKRLAEMGRIVNREKFRQLGEAAGPAGRGLWEFKSFQIRMIGDFRAGCRFVIAHGVIKKRDDLRPEDIDRALRILQAHDRKQSGSGDRRGER